MNPDYLWLTGALQLLTLFVVRPVIAVAIAYAAWRQKPQNFNPQRYGMLCVASGVTASLLLVLAKWINADVRTPQYFLQLACVLLGGLLLGAGMGSLFPVLLYVWRWHKTTRLAWRTSFDLCGMSSIWPVTRESSFIRIATPYSFALSFVGRVYS